MKTKLKIVPTLSTVIGMFVFLTSALILFVEFRASQKLLRDLGSELIVETVSSLGLFLDTRGQDVEEQAGFIATSIEIGSLLLENRQTVASFIYGAMAGTPQTSDIWVVDPEGNAVGVEQGDADGIFTPLLVHIDNLPLLKPIFEEARTSEGAFWTDPIYFTERGQTYFIFADPVRGKDTFQGLVLVMVSISQVSEVAAQLSDEDFTVFMTAENLLVAHPDIEESLVNLSPTKPFPLLEEASDPFIASFKQLERLDNETYGLEDNYEVYFGNAPGGDKRFMVLKRPIKGDFSDVTVGVHFDAELFRQPFLQLIEAALLALAILVIALVCAVFLAKWIARPIRRAAFGARQVADFDLEAVQSLPASKIRELDDLASGFNAMVEVLRAFVRYVPRSLVRRIMSEGRDISAPTERQLAVLFTDIAGFTSVSEKMGAVETAGFINHHLGLVGNAIEANHGTIDKYIGDSVMAFWGAPEHVDHPEQLALSAALSIATAIRQDNATRQTKGLPPVRIRIGIHVGPLVVGDIGAPGRVNYTVIGDTVNIASRLESLGRDVDPDADVMILVSREVIADHSNADLTIEDIGDRAVKGKDQAVHVVRVLV